ncbi:MAG TPA: ATP-binding cassette domain-containing protein, partial [Pseudobdellovibrionaceae bacterium]|nr:ATP-binding cassette domain-containing protein [Pseudobdellovibrionaceae bacterium]
MAGSLLFGGDAVEKKVKVLSGGEKARVALGQILLSKSSLLLLDEPTNHLDFDTVESLTSALASYEGSLVVVSHDRGFIRRIATKILAIEDGRIRAWPGTYDEYVWSLQKGVLSESVPTESSGEKTVSSTAKASSDSVGISRQQRLKQIESEVRRIERALPDLEKKTVRLVR